LDHLKINSISLVSKQVAEGSKDLARLQQPAYGSPDSGALVGA